MLLSYRGLQADLKENDLWKPNSSRETYEHVHHMKTSTVAVHEYTCLRHLWEHAWGMYGNMPEACMGTCLRHVCEHAWGMLALHPIFQLPKQKLRTETQGWIISDDASSVYFILGPSQSLLRLNKISSLAIADEWTLLLKIGCKDITHGFLNYGLLIYTMYLLLLMFCVLFSVLFLTLCRIYCTCEWICHNLPHL